MGFNCLKATATSRRQFTYFLPFNLIFISTPHASSYIMRVDYCGTTTAVLSQNGIWRVYFFFILKYLCNPLLYIPSICSNRICFKVHMAIGVQLGLDKHWKVYSNLRRIWIILINLCHFKHQTGLFSYVSNLDGP